MNLFRKKGINYDFNYLKPEDLVAKPTIDKLDIPQISYDPFLIASLYALDPNAPPEVIDYFKNKAKKTLEEENEKYQKMLAVMENIDFTNRDNELKIIINEKIG